MTWLKAHWPAIMSVAGGIVYFLMPSLQSYAGAHSKTLVGVLLSAVIAAFYANSPLSKGAPKQ